MNIHVIACGRLRNGPYFDLFQDFQKRLQWNLTLTEIESKQKAEAKMQADECALVLDHLNSGAYIIAMDERGKTFSSREFSSKIQDLQNTGQNSIQFILGGANGLSDEIRGRANLLLSFGKQTWPHMLARVMLLEQIYRSQQILKGHPYHKD